jgi:acetate kinase
VSSILVINSGSSSFKYQLIDMNTENTRASGLVERIGEASGHTVHTVVDDDSNTHRSSNTELPIENHTAGFMAMLKAFGDHGPSLTEYPPIAVGHRVVQGGEQFVEPTVITDEVKNSIHKLSALAPLHNPANLEGIIAAEKTFPTVKQVAIFDTAFHRTLPPAAYTYAIDVNLAEQYGVRRYGFHGTSHKFVSESAAIFLGRPLNALKQVILHLGNGASACAVDGGRSIDTSMGMTPLEGLVMGTRSGDIDPAVLFHLNRQAGFSIDQLDELLNRKSGLIGLTGTGDMRDVTHAAESKNTKSGNATAQSQRALDVYTHRLKHYIGAYFAQLGRLDAIVFTAGVGENSPTVRAGALAGLEGLGIHIPNAIPYAQKNHDAFQQTHHPWLCLWFRQTKNSK